MLQRPILLCLAILIVLSFATAVLASPPPWYNDFFSFRHSSALPGMLFGVSPTGEVGFGGAFQQNIPVAYTPVWHNAVLGGNVGSEGTGFPDKLSGAGVNGTFFGGLGFSTAPHGVYVSGMKTGEASEGCWNVQVEVFGPQSDDDERPALALGCQDVFNERNRFPGDHHNSRSVYAVLTGAFPEATWRPIYWSVGWGDGRFQNGFAGVQVPVDDHFKVIGEYDSFNLNAGLAWGLNGMDNPEHSDVIAYGGMTALKHPVLGLTFTWH
jgi:hypothetical protein